MSRWLVGGAGAYAMLCAVLHQLQQQGIADVYNPPEDYTLDAWSEVEPTLQEGDVVLMRGSGLMSWAITTAQYAFSGLRPMALRYSHVAVVVEPAQRRGQVPPTHEANTTRNQKASSSFSATTTTTTTVGDVLRAESAADGAANEVVRGAIILEAMDNMDYHVPDIHGHVRYNCVQRVEATKRLCARAADGTPAYYYFSVRRLKGLHPQPQPHDDHNDDDGHHHPQQQQNEKEVLRRQINAFCEANEGRPMDGSVLYTLSFLHPSIYHWLRPERLPGREVSCSELIVQLYQTLGVVEPRWRWAPLSAGEESALYARMDDHARAELERGEVLPYTRTSMPLPMPNDAASAAGLVSGMEAPLYAAVDGAELMRSPKLAARRAVPQPLDEEDIVERRRWRQVPWISPRNLPRWNIFFYLPGGPLHGLVPHLPEVDAPRAITVVEEQHRSLHLHAGDVGIGRDGRLRQLRPYFHHQSIQTSPYHFAQQADVRYLDYAPGCGLEDEMPMQVPRDGFDVLQLLNQEE